MANKAAIEKPKEAWSKSKTEKAITIVNNRAQHIQTLKSILKSKSGAEDLEKDFTQLIENGDYDQTDSKKLTRLVVQVQKKKIQF